ncbi:hypothetical protein [Marivita sp.]|jgi:hypothetical protein
MPIITNHSPRNHGHALIDPHTDVRETLVSPRGPLLRETTNIFRAV